MKRDNELLLNAGLSEDLIALLPSLAVDLRNSESEWKIDVQGHTRNEVEWKPTLRKGRQLQRFFAKKFTFALRKESQYQNTLPDIKKGRDRADLIQDQ